MPSLHIMATETTPQIRGIHDGADELARDLIMQRAPERRFVTLYQDWRSLKGRVEFCTRAHGCTRGNLNVLGVRDVPVGMEDEFRGLTLLLLWPRASALVRDC